MSSTNGMGPLPVDEAVGDRIATNLTVVGILRHRVGRLDRTARHGVRDLDRDDVLIRFAEDNDGELYVLTKSGRIWYANRADVLAADDGDARTVATISEMDANLRRLTEEKFRERGGKGPRASANGSPVPGGLHDRGR
jgi:hypothetical protein